VNRKKQQISLQSQTFDTPGDRFGFPSVLLLFENIWAGVMLFSSRKNRFSLPCFSRSRMQNPEYVLEKKSKAKYE
jgi:hypothetical protein